FSPSLSAEVILDAFFLHALLKWTRKQPEAPTLCLPHRGTQRSRLHAAMERRNQHMAGTGQDQWAHACDGCSKVRKDTQGRSFRITACVMDGVCIGHPCCAYKDDDGVPCRLPLLHTQDQFCPQHVAQNLICAVRTCILPRSIPFQTCETPSHRALEAALPQPGSSMMQLLERRERNRSFQAARRTGSDSTAVSTPAPGPSHGRGRGKAKSAKTKAVFRRTFTHNEQLIVRPCGIIVARCTMYQAEAVSGAKEFVMRTFPETHPGSKPTYLFYDNNCQLHAYIAAPGHPKVQEYWECIHKPVDVFHFFCKHAETDILCQTYCNPALFPDLMENGKWTFNTSAAEQVNAWLVHFKTVVREMEETRYNFFLDEIISLRNETTVRNLEKKG
ncbi:hypothetical protein EXIGLDRAFT_580701, partial [Exidia glandulosa HHB12029]